MPSFLLVKTSSLGDVLHNLPVVSDLLTHFPNAQIDWVVEENFAALPALHPGVRQVFTVAIRRWRKNWWTSRAEMDAAFRQFQRQRYDVVLDTQGLIKSAWLTRKAQGVRCGFAWDSAREPLAGLCYDKTFHVVKQLHAVERNRRLAAAACDYALTGAADYGIRSPDSPLPWLMMRPFVVFLHATSRDDKLWDESSWIELGRQLNQTGLSAVLPWGNPTEKQRADRLCAAIPGSIPAPRLDLNEAASLLAQARAVVGVDTGLSHLAAALGVPTVGLYVATDPGLTGLYAGNRALNLGGKNAPPPLDKVIEALTGLAVHV